MFKIQKLMLISFFTLFSALQAQGLAEIAHLPYAQQLITRIFKERGLSPDQFNFKFSNEPISWFYVVGENTFGCNLEFLERLNQLATEIKEKSSIKSRLMNYLTGRDKEFNDSVLLLEGLLGHEIQHHFDRKRLEEIFRSINDNRDSLLELEKKADLCSSNNPEVLKALASYFKKRYEKDNAMIEFAKILKARGLSIQEPEEDKDHPDPLVRASYLRKKADELERQKELFKKIQENYLMLSN